jgi:peptidoglycan-associated lipoprotein
MTSKTVTLVAILFGIGCSHATPKPESPATVVASAPRSAPPPARRQETIESAPVADRDDSGGNAIFFGLDSSAISSDARATLQHIGQEVAHSRKAVRIEGNCDERGTTEYNLALGDRRAREAKKYLERLGVSERRISVVSYGSERPKDPMHDESAWSKNRRDDFRVQ